MLLCVDTVRKQQTGVWLVQQNLYLSPMTLKSPPLSHPVACLLQELEWLVSLKRYRKEKSGSHGRPEETYDAKCECNLFSTVVSFIVCSPGVS